MKHSPRKPLETTDVEKKGPELGKLKGERKIYGVVSILIFFFFVWYPKPARREW